MSAHLKYKEVLERLEDDICELSLEEDSDLKEDGIYGYMAEVDNALSLAALCSEWVLNAGEKDDLGRNSDAAPLVLQDVQQYLCLAW